MAELVCITNDIPGFRACTIRDEHQANCNGWGYRYTESGHRATGHPCTGCAPRPASHGLLCRSCYERLTDALAKIGPWFIALHGVERALVRDNAGIRSSKSGPPLPLSPLYLTRDEVESWEKTYPGDPDVWISSVDGAIEAVNFTKVTLAAVAAHEHEERPHKVRRVRCPKCGYLNLLWQAPSQPRDQVTITCTSDGCTGDLTQLAYEQKNRDLTRPQRESQYMTDSKALITEARTPRSAPDNEPIVTARSLAGALRTAGEYGDAATIERLAAALDAAAVASAENRSLITRLADNLELANGKLAKLDEEQVIDWFSTHASSAVMRVVDAGQKVVKERIADGVFE